MHFKDYQTTDFFEELMKPTGRPRSLAMPLIEQINALSPKELRRRQKAAELALMFAGLIAIYYKSITFMLGVLFFMGIHSALFGPVMTLWFLALGVLGAVEVAKEPKCASRLTASLRFT